MNLVSFSRTCNLVSFVTRLQSKLAHKNIIVGIPVDQRSQGVTICIQVTTMNSHSKTAMQRGDFVSMLTHIRRALTSHIPLATLVHLALDSWFPPEKHAVTGHSDTQAFLHTQTKLHEIKNLIHVPAALVSPSLKMKTLKNYCLAIIFLRSFGMAWTLTAQLKHHDKVQILFKNKFVTLIKTRNVVHQFLHSFTSIPIKDIKTFLQASALTDNARAQQFRTTLEQLQNNVAGTLDCTLNIDLAKMYNGPHYIPPKSSPRKKRKQNSKLIPLSVLHEGTDIDIGTNDVGEDDAKMSSVNTSNITINPVEGSILSEIHEHDDQALRDASSVPENDFNDSEYFVTHAHVRAYMQLPFKLDKIDTCTPHAILSYLSGHALACQFQIAQYSTDANILVQQQFNALQHELQVNIVHASYALLRVQYPNVIHTFYLRQIKWAFKKFNIRPSIANDILKTISYNDPHADHQVTFPFAEDLGFGDQIKPLPVTLRSPPPVKIKSPKDKLLNDNNSHGYDIDENGFAIFPTNPPPLQSDPMSNDAPEKSIGAQKVAELFTVGKNVKTEPTSSRKHRPHNHSLLDHGMRYGLSPDADRPPPVQSHVASSVLGLPAPDPHSSTTSRSISTMTTEHVNLVDDKNKMNDSIIALNETLKKTLVQFQRQYHEQHQQIRKEQQEMEKRLTNLLKTSKENSRDLSVDTDDSDDSDSKHSSKEDKFKKYELRSRVRSDKSPSDHGDSGDDSSDDESSHSHHSKSSKHKRKNKKKKKKRKRSIDSSVDSDDSTLRIGFFSKNDSFRKKTSQKAMVTEEAKSKRRNIENSLTLKFYGYPNQSYKPADDKTVCENAIKFIVHLLMWFVLYVQPNKKDYSKSSALDRAKQNICGQAKQTLNLYESQNERIKDIRHLVLYIVKQYIKQHNMPNLQIMVLETMPNSAQIRNNISTAFKKHELMCGVFNEILNMATQLQCFPNDAYTQDLKIRSKDRYDYIFNFLVSQGIDKEIDSQLTNEPLNIRIPKTMNDLMTALEKLESRRDAQAIVKSHLASKHLQFRQNDTFSDPTATIAGRNANANSAYFGNYNNNYNNNRRRGQFNRRPPFNKNNNYNNNRRQPFNRRNQFRGNRNRQYNNNNYGKTQYPNFNQNNNNNNNFRPQATFSDTQLTFTFEPNRSNWSTKRTKNKRRNYFKNRRNRQQRQQNVQQGQRYNNNKQYRSNRYNKNNNWNRRNNNYNRNNNKSWQNRRNYAQTTNQNNQNANPRQKRFQQQNRNGQQQRGQFRKPRYRKKQQYAQNAYSNGNPNRGQQNQNNYSQNPRNGQNFYPNNSNQNATTHAIIQGDYAIDSSNDPYYTMQSENTNHNNYAAFTAYAPRHA